MSHDTRYIESLPLEVQVKHGNGTHVSILRLLRSGLTVAQVERYLESEVYEHYLQLKQGYVQLWEQV